MKSPWFYSPRPTPRPRLRLFCIPHSGGSAAAYRAWPASLPADIEVCAIQLPGRAERLREPPLDRVDAMVRGIVEAVKPLLSEAPFAIFGHSLGGLLAFEVGRALRREGGPLPAQVFVSSCYPPNAAGR